MGGLGVGDTPSPSVKQVRTQVDLVYAGMLGLSRFIRAFPASRRIGAGLRKQGLGSFFLLLGRRNDVTAPLCM